LKAFVAITAPTTTTIATTEIATPIPIQTPDENPEPETGKY